MKLSCFIIEQMETILAEWDSFARTQCPDPAGISAAELRDHAEEILNATARDIETAQSSRQQSEKSKGLEARPSDAVSAASIHGSQRQQIGFSMDQLIAEYRALRATVLRLWLKNISEVTDAASDDMVRFNESMDQALAESARTYAENRSRTRDTFLAILGHDLRSPLSTMALAGEYLTSPGVGTDQTQEVGARVKRSAATMTSMVNDLLEYSRTQLGSEMPIDKRPADVWDICQAAIHDASAAHPHCEFEMEVSGDTNGCFDSDRLQQLFTNLLNNAAQYRSKEHPVTIVVRGDRDEILVQVQNWGPVIPADALSAIFDPLVQLSRDGQEGDRPSTSLGLGLFIARQVTQAHGGTITAQSSAGAGTVFSVRLPTRSDEQEV